MTIGQLSTPISILQPGTNTNSFGQAVSTYTPVEQAWAQMRDTSANETREASQIVSLRSVVFTIRYTPNVSMRHRILADGDTFEITGLNIIGRKQFIELSTVQRATT